MIDRIVQYFKNFNKRGFTLVEVLLAVVIVGIIAAIVLPSVYTQYQTKTLEYKKDRLMNSIQSAVDQLKVTENVKSFRDTMMYSNTMTYTVDDKPGKFLKKYFRVAKYCGAPNTNGSSDCFASEYSSYSDSNKKVVNVKDLNLQGACALLKNGASICITPQLPGNNPISVILDLNGPQGPNIVGRDFVVAKTLDLIDVTSDLVNKASDDTVLAMDETLIIPDKENMCISTTDASDPCCEYKVASGLVTKADDACCGNVNYAGGIPVCYKEADIHVNYYPVGGSVPGSSVPAGAQVWARGGYNTEIDPPNLKIPEGLTIRVKCGNGSISGATLTSETLQKAIDASSGEFYFTGKVYNTSCYYPKETLIWDHAEATDGGTTIAYKGLIYHLHQH